MSNNLDWPAAGARNGDEAIRSGELSRVFSYFIRVFAGFAALGGRRQVTRSVENTIYIQYQTSGRGYRLKTRLTAITLVSRLIRRLFFCWNDSRDFLQTECLKSFFDTFNLNLCVQKKKNPFNFYSTKICHAIIWKRMENRSLMRSVKCWKKKTNGSEISCWQRVIPILIEYRNDQMNIVRWQM